jgi:hypothetical protein
MILLWVLSLVYFKVRLFFAKQSLSAMKLAKSKVSGSNSVRENLAVDMLIDEQQARIRELLLKVWVYKTLIGNKPL